MSNSRLLFLFQCFMIRSRIFWTLEYFEERWKNRHHKLFFNFENPFRNGTITFYYIPYIAFILHSILHSYFSLNSLNVQFKLLFLFQSHMLGSRILCILEYHWGRWTNSCHKHFSSLKIQPKKKLLLI